MAQPFPLAPELLLTLDRHPFCVLDERAQLGKSFGRRLRSANEVVVHARRRLKLAPGHPQPRPLPQLLLSAEGVEHVELVRRSCEPALLELTGHGHEPLGGGRHVLTSSCSSPRIGTRAAVAEDAPRDDEPLLVLGAQLEERQEVLLVERPGRRLQLGFDVRVCPLGAHERDVATRAEQQPDGLGEDRLPRSRLTGDRVEARSQVELGLPDQDEVLDAQPTKQRSPDNG